MTTITATAGSIFTTYPFDDKGGCWTEQDNQSLAFLVYQRFGWDWPAATAAWNRLHQTNITVDIFQNLVRKNS